MTDNNSYNSYNIKRFLNFTELDEKEAEEKVSRMREMVVHAESALADRRARAERSFEIFKNRIWDTDDLEFFEANGLTAYEFSVARPLINNLIARQRNRRFTFQVVPRDVAAYRRFEAGKDVFMQENMHLFNSIQEAEEYYDEYADDEYANMINALMQSSRYESNATLKESECFQSGLVVGGDFMKATMSRKNNTSGAPEIERKSMRQMIHDPLSLDYFLEDAEYIGEVHRMYIDELIEQYPDRAEELREKYKSFTQKNLNRIPHISDSWNGWFKMDNESDVQLKVVELWKRETEKRLLLIDLQSGDKRLLLPGITLEDVTDQKAAEMLEAMLAEGLVDVNQDTEMIQKQVLAEVEKRYKVDVVFEPIWYKCVFTMGALLEYKRSPYSHNSHPYTPFWAQFADGHVNSLLEDIQDIIIALNKALAFREMLMAHSSKGMIIVDEKALADSGISVDQIADAYTQIGSIVAIKLKQGKQIQDIVHQITTVGDGIAAINSIIADYDNRLYQISGVNLAQMGMAQGETPASRFRMQISEGENNNALIFDNFVRSMEWFYSKKVVPLVVDMAKNRKDQVVRQLGDQVKPWVQIDLDPDEGLYDDTLRGGVFSCVLTPNEDNPQLDEARSAKYMELAMAGAIPVEVALEFSNDPNRHRIVQKIKRWKHKSLIEQAKNQVDMQQVMQVMMQNGVSSDVADDIMKKVRLQNEMQQQAQNPNAQGAQTIQQQSAEPQRLQNIENKTLQ
jgi:hypothetical protein